LALDRDIFSPASAAFQDDYCVRLVLIDYTLAARPPFYNRQSNVSGF